MPGETTQELAARVRNKAFNYDFQSIQDTFYETMTTCFICACNNEAILQAIFKRTTDSLKFQDVVNVASEVEDSSKSAKDHMLATMETVHKLAPSKSYPFRNKSKSMKSSRHKCASWGKPNHPRDTCRFRNSKCNFCGKIGHIENTCYGKQKVKTFNEQVGLITLKLDVSLSLHGTLLDFEVDTGSLDNFISKKRGKILGKPTLTPSTINTSQLLSLQYRLWANVLSKRNYHRSSKVPQLHSWLHLWTTLILLD